MILLQEAFLLQNLKWWAQFSQSKDFNPQMGYLINPSLKLQQSKQFLQLHQILNNLSQFKSSKQLQQKIRKLNFIDQSFFNQKYKQIYFRECLSYITGKYLYLVRKQGVSEIQIKIPFPLSKMLKDSSQRLGIKIGPTAALSFNWKWKNKQQEIKKENQIKNFQNLVIKRIDLDDIESKYFYSNNKDQQKIFFGTSICASYYIGQMIKFLFLINKLIKSQNFTEENKKDIIKLLLDRIIEGWEYIHKLMFNLSQKLNPQIFYHQIRLYVKGFDKIQFEGYEGQRFSSGGGSTGEDPSYQIFQKAMGINIYGQFINVQKKLQQGIYQKHKQIQEYFLKQSQIKKYCCESNNSDLQQKYKKCFEVYKQMNRIHNVFIREYILRFIPQQYIQEAEGTGGNKITNVQNRWKMINYKQKIQN